MKTRIAVYGRILDNRLPIRDQELARVAAPTAGRTPWVELQDVLSDKELRLEEAHDVGTELERRIKTSEEGDAVVHAAP